MVKPFTPERLANIRRTIQEAEEKVRNFKQYNIIQ